MLGRLSSATDTEKKRFLRSARQFYGEAKLALKQAQWRRTDVHGDLNQDADKHLGFLQPPQFTAGYLSRSVKLGGPL